MPESLAKHELMELVHRFAGDDQLEAFDHAVDAVVIEKLDELRRAVCVIGIVGRFSERDVIFRESVLDIIQFRIANP
jgi:hypothetical protein